MMNFEEWWNDGGGVTNNDPYIFDNKGDSERDCARYAWQACKAEVLKILEENSSEMCSHGHDAGMKYVYLDFVEKEIKNL